MFEIPTPDVIPDESIPFLPNPFTKDNIKRFMNPIRYRTNYNVFPAYLAICVLCFGLAIVFMSIDKNKYLWVFIICMSLWAIVSTVLVSQIPKTRKQEITIELSRYDFDRDHFPMQDRYKAENELWEVYLTQTGLVVNGKRYYYSSLRPTLITSNHFMRIWVSIQFGDGPWNGVYVPLDGSIIRAIEEFEIPISNPEEFAYLLQHKEEAFMQIYVTGKIRVPNEVRSFR